VVRLLLADEVGLGKTLSLGTAALTLCLLADKEHQARNPMVIFAPATLCEQWQTEMIDKLGIPTARWDTLRKVWLDTEERAISPAGREQIAQCPLRIGIVSTGLMMRDSLEKQQLLGLRFGVVIFDEAHKARTRQGFGGDAGTPNALLAFMREIAAHADHLLLGTATPIQTRPEDLWDLMSILHQGKGRFVLGNDFTPWHHPRRTLPILAGATEVTEPAFAWELLRSPLPLVDSTQEPRARRLFSAIRQDLELVNGEWQTHQSLMDLSEDTREILEEALERRIASATFFQRENPLVRHIVLRQRVRLEDAGLLTRVGVEVHPDRQRVRNLHRFDALFEGKALRTSEDFREAYREARRFGQALAQRGNGGGFMKNRLEQRICSSIQAGLNTARMLLEGRTLHEEEDEQEADVTVETSEEREVLARLINIDLPWNPTRLEQRIGRIKHFGQQRETVDMLNEYCMDRLARQQPSCRKTYR
jgi:hypothetical protein